MYFLFFSVLLFICFLLGFINQNKIEHIEWMDRSFTTVIKGFSILTVVWAHTGAKLGMGGIQFIADIGVALFLICSGYGLEVSYHKNGLKYFWKKRFLKVCIPFWIVELMTTVIKQNFVFSDFVLNIVFFKSLWFLRYIVICYIIFYIVSKIVNILKFKNNEEIYFLLFIFALWFVIESLFFANPDMPFLEARQMLSFPLGVIIAKYKDKIVNIIHKLSYTQNIFIVFGVGVIGIVFMVVTQLNVIKSQPYIISNALSLLTVLPLAIVILLIGILITRLFRNLFLYECGLVSYEIYLIHIYTLSVVSKSVLSLMFFIIITICLAILLHLIMNITNR